MHNFATGRATGVHWGLPISILETTSQTPYWFNFHQRDIGHFLVTGPTGSGKTVVLDLPACAGFSHLARTARPSSSTRIAAPRFSSAPSAATTRFCSPAFRPASIRSSSRTTRPIAISCLACSRRCSSRPTAAASAQEEEDTLERAIARICQEPVAAAHAGQSVWPPDGPLARRRERSPVAPAALVRGREGLALQCAARRPVLLGPAHLRLRHDAHPGQPGGAHAGADVPLPPARRAAHRRAGPDLHGRGLEAAPGPDFLQATSSTR